MTTMTTDEAKNHLDDLLAKAAEGEKVIIVGENGATFNLTPTEASTGTKRGFVGSMKGQIWMANDFDDIPEGFEDYLSEEKE